MKNKLVTAIAVIAASAFVFADTASEGGMVLNPKSFQGKAAIINVQKRVRHREIEAVAKVLAEASGCNVVAEIANGGAADAAALKKKSEAGVVVIIVSDEITPAMLLAPEDNWGVVNVQRLVSDLASERAKEKFLAGRTRKETIRAFSILCGGGSSQFKGNVMNADTLRETDYMKETIPVDLIAYWQRHLATLGITRKKMASYADACQQGWAPQPTNDVQRTIWNQVHAIPDKPITIEFDSKRDKGK